MNGQWSLLLAVGAAQSPGGQRGWEHSSFLLIQSPLSLHKMLLGDFLGEKVGSFQEEFRETTLKTGILVGSVRGDVF